MKVVAFSDTHNQHKKITLPDGDILIYAGDCAIHGTELEVEDFAKWIKTQPHKFKCAVAGNHDECLQDKPEIFQDNGIEYLCDREININGLRIYGTPWRSVPRERVLGPKSRWSAFMITEPWDEYVFREIPNGLDILITHMPPFGIMDIGSHWKKYEIREPDTIIGPDGKFWKFIGFKSWGNKALLKNIKRAKPKHSIFGHIHDISDILVDDGITFYNVSMCDAEYNLRAQVKTFEVNL